MTIETVWEPHRGSQELFMTCPCDEVLFHGTRGPGKTDALLMDFAQDVGAGYGASWRGILFRQTYKQLEDVVTKTLKWFPRIFPEATFNRSDYTWQWPDGEALLLRYMDKPVDYWNYHGHEYPWIGWEELTNWATLECYELMLACNRSSDPDIPKRIRSTCNPWGAGHHAVKSYFIDPSPACVPVIEEITHPLTGEVLKSSRTHIFGHLFENTTLLRNDPKYLINLQKIKDEQKRKAWLEGSWDISVGSFFADSWDAGRSVIKHPWTPPKHWRCSLSFDWGSASPFSLGMWAESDGTEAPDGKFYPRGALIRFDEWYGKRKDEPNVGLKMQNVDIGKGIIDRVRAYEAKGLHFKVGPADPSMFKEDGGPSIYAQIKSGAQGRELFQRADNTRVTGWQKVTDMMEGEDDGGPKLYVMANCREWIRTVPVLSRDERNWDDIDTDEEDHCFAGGTKVLTRAGEFRLDEVPPRGEVWTEDGFKPYRNARKTRRNVETVVVIFSDGRRVQCTPDHLFMTENGPIAAENLTGKKCMCSQSAAKFSLVKSIIFADSIFSGWAGARGAYTGASGNTTMARSLMDGISTMLTKTGQITTSAISKCFPDPCTYPCTQSNSSKTVCSDHPVSWRVKMPRSGTQAKRAELGTLSTLNELPHSRTSSRWISRVSIAAVATLLKGLMRTRRNSATRIAKPLLCVSVEETGRADVYCLTVPEYGWFTVEDGIVVSNCADETRYMCMWKPIEAKVIKIKGY